MTLQTDYDGLSSKVRGAKGNNTLQTILFLEEERDFFVEEGIRDIAQDKQELLERSMKALWENELEFQFQEELV